MGKLFFEVHRRLAWPEHGGQRGKGQDQEITAWRAFWNMGGMRFIQQSDVVDLCLKRIIYYYTTI